MALDDYAGLVDHKPGASTGNNLLLTKFSYFDHDGSAFERWDEPEVDGEEDGDKTFDKSDNDWTPTGYPGEPGNIGIIFEGTTGTLYDVEVEWRVITYGQDACFDGEGTEYTVGTNSVDLSVNGPYWRGPDVWDFSGVPPSPVYKLCAKVDPDNEISETSGGDNVIYSESYIKVQL